MAPKPMLGTSLKAASQTFLYGRREKGNGLESHSTWSACHVGARQWHRDCDMYGVVTEVVIVGVDEVVIEKGLMFG